MTRHRRTRLVCLFPFLFLAMVFPCGTGSDAQAGAAREVEERVRRLERETQRLRTALDKCVKEVAQLRLRTESLESSLSKPARPASSRTASTVWDSFRGAQWGSDLRRDRRFVYRPNPLKSWSFYKARLYAYKRPMESLSLGKAKVESITYDCYKNRLCMALIRIKGLRNFDGAREFLSETYGRPLPMREYDPGTDANSSSFGAKVDPVTGRQEIRYYKYLWKGRNSKGEEVSLMLSYDVERAEGFVRFRHLPIFSEFWRDWQLEIKQRKLDHSKKDQPRPRATRP